LSATELPTLIMYPPLIGGGIKRWCCLRSGVCLSRTSGLSRERRGLDHFKIKAQRWRSPGRFTHRGLNAWSRCSGDRENVLGVGNYCYVASARRRARRWGAHGGRRGATCRHAHSLSVLFLSRDIGIHNMQSTIRFYHFRLSVRPSVQCRLKKCTHRHHSCFSTLYTAVNNNKVRPPLHIENGRPCKSLPHV